MSKSATQIIDIKTQISAKGLGLANFGSAVLFATKADLKNAESIGVDEFMTFTDAQGVAEFFSEETEVYEVASIWLGGTPTNKDLVIYVRDSGDATWETTLNKARNQLWWYFTFVTEATYSQAEEVKTIARWCENNGSFFPNCQTGDSAMAIRMETVDSDIASELRLLGYRHCATMAHASDAYAGIYLCKHFARVNYQAQKSTITGEYKKSPGLEAETLKGSEYTAMDKKQTSYYTVVDLQGSEDLGRWLNTITHSTYGEWIDDVINLDAFVNAVRVAVYNVIANQTTKLPQTPVGQAMVLGAVRTVCQQYVENNFLGARTYIDPDDAQEKTTLGYEILTKPEDILTISDDERAKRLCAPIRLRVFRAGAIHSAQITVDVF